LGYHVHIENKTTFIHAQCYSPPPPPFPSFTQLKHTQSQIAMIMGTYISRGEPSQRSLSPLKKCIHFDRIYFAQGVTKRCRLSLLTNSSLVIRVQMRGDGGGGSCGVSANENSCAHHVTWSPNKLWRSTVPPYLTYDFASPAVL
jgi:hypothetical protein